MVVPHPNGVKYPDTMSAEPEPVEVGLMLLRAYRRFESTLISELRAAGWRDVRPAHSQVFAHLDRGGSRASDLARRAAITRQAMSELVRELETLGYVEQAAVPSNRSARLVRLTARGVEHVRAARAVVRRLEADIGATIGAAGLDALRALATGEWAGAASPGFADETATGGEGRRRRGADRVRRRLSLAARPGFGGRLPRQSTSVAAPQPSRKRLTRDL